MSDEQLPPTHQPYGQVPPAQNPYGQPMYAPAGDGGTIDERNWASAAHWGSFVAAFVALAFLAPLLVMLVKGPQSPFIRRHAVESLNFQLSMLIYSFVGGLLLIPVAIFTLGIGLLLIIPLAIAAGVLWIVCVAQGSIKASQGLDYHYPLTMRLVN